MIDLDPTNNAILGEIVLAKQKGSRISSVHTHTHFYVGFLMPTSAFLIQDVPEGKVGKDMGNATRSPGCNGFGRLGAS